MNLKHSFKELNQEMSNSAKSFIARPFKDKEEKERLTHKEINLYIKSFLDSINKLKKKIEKCHKHLDKLEKIEEIYDKKYWQSLHNSAFENINIEEEIKKLDKNEKIEKSLKFNFNK